MELNNSIMSSSPSRRTANGTSGREAANKQDTRDVVGARGRAARDGRQVQTLRRESQGSYQDS